MFDFVFYLGGLATGQTVSRRDFLKQAFVGTGALSLADVLMANESAVATTLQGDELCLNTSADRYIATQRDFPYEFDAVVDQLDDIFTRAPHLTALSFDNLVSAVFGNRLQIERLVSSPR